MKEDKWNGKEPAIGLPPPVLDLTPGRKPDGTVCNHDPMKLYMWLSNDPEGKQVISVRCGDCQRLLAGHEPIQ